MAEEDDAVNVSFMSKTIQLSPADDNIGDKTYPLVFKCAKCSQIIGDSISWVCSNEDLRSITLKHISDDVKQGTKLKMSTEGFDIGSAYLPLTCGSCSVCIGRFYRTTPCHLDEIREMYTIAVDCIESYQLGSNTQQAVDGIMTDNVVTMAQLKSSLDDHKQTVDAALAENAITVMQLKSCLDEHKKRLATLEEMLNVTHSTPSSDTESATSSVTNDTNKAPEFRAPRPVPQSAEHVMSRRSSATVHDKTAASSAAGNGCYTTPLTNNLSKRRKFNEN